MCTVNHITTFHFTQHAVFNEVLQKQKSGTRLTASVLKQDPNTWKVQRTLVIRTRHNMWIFRIIPFYPEKNLMFCLNKQRSFEPWKIVCFLLINSVLLNLLCLWFSGSIFVFQFFCFDFCLPFVNVTTKINISCNTSEDTCKLRWWMVLDQTSAAECHNQNSANYSGAGRF